jgi:signal transduction histidine kinase
MSRLHTSLFWKLMLAFIVVVGVAVGSVALIARQTTTSEFYRLLQRQGQPGDSDLARRLAVYYARNGSWEGVSPLLREGRGQGQGGGRSGPASRLADGDGRLVAGTADDQVGQLLSATELAQGEAIVVDGQRVGTLLTGRYGNQALSQAEQAFLDQVQQALIVGGLAAIGVALAVGFLLFRGIIAPLRRLTQATGAVAAGDLSVRVPPSGDDEIGQLAQAFNRMTDDLARSDQLRRDMTADIAHELRTPLTVIQGNLEAMLDGVYPTDAEHLEPMLHKTHLLKRLVDDLHTLALADAGELTLNRGRLDLGELARRTVKDFQVQAQAAGVTLSGEIPAQLPPAWADAARVEQVLGILLDNALRHTPPQGQITVKLWREDSALQLSVRDTGAGIPPEALPHVFKRFYRLGPDSPRPGGSGLGLAIAWAIVTAHGGRIWAASTPGQGTTMTLVLEQAGSQ